MKYKVRVAFFEGIYACLCLFIAGAFHEHGNPFGKVLSFVLFGFVAIVILSGIKIEKNEN